MKDERAHLQLFDLIARDWALASPVRQITFSADDRAVAFASVDGSIHLAATADKPAPDKLPSIAEKTKGLQKIDGYVPLYWQASSGKLFMEIGRFNHDKADFLIVLPAGYPDVRPDMFFAIPWLKLIQGDRYPKAADQPYDFNGQRWQQWSRHQEHWRPGVDGIWTMLRRLDTALEIAA